MSNPPGGYPPAQLIFLLGIMPRSGTNYLFDLLLAHAGCTASRVPEDFLLAHAHLLDNYVRTVHSHWLPGWGLDCEALYARLRPALVDLLAAPDESRRIVCKTPSVDNLDLFYQLFPATRLLLLVRDGRAVVESSLKTFKHWTFETTTRQWAQAARNIARFDQAHRGDGSAYLIVRYEDLYTRQEAELRRIYDFLGLDTTDFNFARVENIPVRGSSVLRGEEAVTHWKPVSKPADFNPLERFSQWIPAQHARFNWLAGDALRLLGYEPTQPAGSAAYWKWHNRWLDAALLWARWRRGLRRRLVRGRGA